MNNNKIQAHVFGLMILVVSGSITAASRPPAKPLLLASDRAAFSVKGILKKEPSHQLKKTDQASSGHASGDREKRKKSILQQEEKTARLVLSRGEQEDEEEDEEDGPTEPEDEGDVLDAIPCLVMVDKIENGSRRKTLVPLPYAYFVQAMKEHEKEYLAQMQ